MTVSLTHTRTIETERLNLRAPTAEDWPVMRDFFMSDRAAFVGGPYTLAKAWRHFAAEIGHWVIKDFGMWAVTDKSDGTLYGLVGPWCPDDWPEQEVGWVITHAAEGKGIAYEAATAVVRDCFDTLGWSTVVSYIDPDNTRSIKLAERMGAVLDADAPQPKPDQPCLVYRHPKEAS